jgi:hypothetical protein
VNKEIYDLIEVEGERKLDATDHSVPVEQVTTINLSAEFFGRLQFSVACNPTDIPQ